MSIINKFLSSKLILRINSDTSKVLRLSFYLAKYTNHLTSNKIKESTGIQ